MIIRQCILYRVRKLEYHIVMMIYHIMHNAQLHLGISLIQTRTYYSISVLRYIMHVLYTLTCVI